MLKKRLVEDSGKVKASIINLINNSENISKDDKDKLINIIDNDTTYNFLKEVFYFAVENTVNIDLKLKLLKICKKPLLTLIITLNLKNYVW